MKRVACHCQYSSHKLFRPKYDSGRKDVKATRFDHLAFFQFEIVNPFAGVLGSFKSVQRRISTSGINERVFTCP